MTPDCRTCRHNTYADAQPPITDWFACSHPIAIARGPHWQPGDPAVVSLRTGDFPMSEIGETRDCPTWEKRP